MSDTAPTPPRRAPPPPRKSASVPERVMAAINRLKAKLMAADAGPITSIWLSLASEMVTELLAGAGFGAVVIDTEHAPNDISQTRLQIMAAELKGCSVIARTPINEPWVIKRLMDVGAQTILVPMIDIAEQAEAAASALRFPPEGTRGVAASTRAADFGRAPNYLATANEQACLIAQIETLTAVKNIEAIAAVEGVDALFIGPSDLSASAGHLGNPAAPMVESVIEDAIRRIVATGKPCGIFCFDPQKANKYIGMGVRLVAVASDVSLLVAGARLTQSKFE